MTSEQGKEQGELPIEQPENSEQGEQPQEQAQSNHELGQRPSWSITRAAQECGVSRSTIRRYRERGDFKNAHKDEGGEWLIPVTDLIAAGLPPKSRPDDEYVSRSIEQVQQNESMLSEHDLELLELRHELELERVRREYAERLAQEREKQVDDLRGAMRMIEVVKPQAAPQPQAEPVQHPEPESEPQSERPQPQRSGFWARVTGR